MYKYYLTDLNVMIVKDIKINPNSLSKVSIITDNYILEKDVLIYINKCGVPIIFDGDYPILYQDEAHGWLIDVARSKGIKTSCNYIDSNNLKPVSLSKEDEKRLIKSRKESQKLHKQ